MELAMQVNSNGKTVRSDTIEVLKDFNTQSLATQAEKGEHLVSMMPAIKKTLIYWALIRLTYLQELKLWKSK